MQKNENRVIAIFAVLVTCFGGSVSYAADPPAKTYQIGPQSVSAALKAFAAQSDMQLIFTEKDAGGAKSEGVTGTKSAREALQEILKGTALEFEFTANNVVVVKKASAGVLATKSSDPPEDRRRDGKSNSSDGFRVAQATQSTGPTDSSVEKDQSSKQEPVKLEEVHVNIPEIMVTGSRIMNVDVKRTVDDVQPYYILDSKQIEQSGATNVEDFLKQQLTMNTTFNSNSQRSPSSGFVATTSTINLRGLGDNETLILIDGRRSAGVLTQGGITHQPDINSIPLSAIERIEVLPSSASAIYGGAAVGGVLNIVLKKNFRGGEVNTTYEDTTNASAPLRTVNGTYGFSLADGKTNVMLAGHYSDGQVLLIQDRLDLIGRGISTILNNSPSFFYSSSNPFQGATPNIASTSGNLTLRNGTSLNSPITSIPAGAAPGSDLSAGLLTNAGAYNLNLAPGTGAYGLQNAIGSVPRDKALMVTVRQDLMNNIEGFVEFSTQSNVSRTLNNPFSGNHVVPSSAPDNPFQQDVTVNFPSALSLPYTSDSVTQSLTVGLLARLPADWKSELDYTWSRNAFEYALTQSDDTAFSAALASGAVNPFADTIAYPLNFTPYLVPQTYAGSSTLNDLGLRVSGSVGSFPWGRPSLTIGLEHREEGSHDSDVYQVYPVTPANNFHLHFFGQLQSTNSVYAEAEVPLVTAKNALPLIRALDLQLAGRSENYTVFAGTPFVYLSPAAYQAFSPPQGVHTTIKYTSTNPTIGLKYKPVEDLIFRVSYAKAFLPPTASQLLPNPTPDCGCAYLPITDPKNGQTYNIDTASAGGNPNLQPQTAKDWDLGVIWEPKEEVLKGLRMDLEYYKITQPNYITQPSAQQVVSNPAYASRVTRDPTTGLITIVDLSLVNAVIYKTNGWDLTLNYRKPTTYGAFDLRAMGTVIERDLRQYTIGGAFLDYVGYPSELGEAKTKANATLTWEVRQWTLGWTTTYFGSYLQTGSPGSPSVLQSGPNPRYTDAQGGYTIPSQTYHELFASYVFDKTTAGQTSGMAHNLLSNLTVQLGIKNVFNTPPPFDARSHYFYSSYGDPRLRDYRINIRKSW